MSLFDYQVIPLSLADKTDLSELIFWPQWLSVKQADKLLKTSIESFPWRHDSIKMSEFFILRYFKWTFQQIRYPFSGPIEGSAF